MLTFLDLDVQVHQGRLRHELEKYMEVEEGGGGGG